MTTVRTTVRRAITVAMVTAAVAVFGPAAAAHAQTDGDERFEEAVSSLGITAGPETDIPALGRNVCHTMTQEMARNPNPPPIVRGLVSSVQRSNLTREQALGFVRASLTAYCPQFVRFMGR